MDALIMVDVQNDFCACGALAVPDGDDVVAPINRLIEQADYVVATRDWHPADHGSFAAQGGPWPEHCVQGSHGADLHGELDHAGIDVVLDKGRHRDREGYSGFEDTELEALLREHGVKTVHVAGLALDYCVRATALEARARGFAVVLHRDATRAVDVAPGDGDRALAALRDAGVSVVS